MSELSKINDQLLLSSMQYKKAKWLVENECGVIRGCIINIETTSGLASVDMFGRVTWVRLTR